jgi:hypothetical protein
VYVWICEGLGMQFPGPTRRGEQSPSLPRYGTELTYHALLGERHGTTQRVGGTSRRFSGHTAAREAFRPVRQSRPPKRRSAPSASRAAKEGDGRRRRFSAQPYGTYLSTGDNIEVAT